MYAIRPLLRLLLFSSALAAASVHALAGGPPRDSAAQPPPPATLRSTRAVRLPVVFEANKGQTDPRAAFVARGNRYAMFVETAGAATFVIRGPVTGRAAAVVPQKLVLRDRFSAPPAQDRLVLRLAFVGANVAPRPTGADPQKGVAHYYAGKDPQAWRMNVPTFGRIETREIYKSVTLEYSGSTAGVAYRFRVSPGGDPRAIRMRWNTTAPTTIDRDGGLRLRFGRAELRQPAPVLYQESGGRRAPVPGGYDVTRGDVGFRVAPYDRSRPLMIDPPMVSWTTYMGGEDLDRAAAIAVTADGSVVIAGETESLNYPTAGAAQSTIGGQTDAFVTRLEPGGMSLVYSTYLGGAARDVTNGVALDGEANAYVTGTTASADFPTLAPLQSATAGNDDAFVARLSATGTLQFATYFGGHSADYGSAIAVDASGMYVSGLSNSTDFPTRQPAQAAYQGGGDGFVAKIGLTGAPLIYATYLGGNAVDAAVSIAVRDGRAWIGGSTESTNFPVQQAYDSTRSGWEDAFIARLAPSGSALEYSTCLGGSGRDNIGAIVVLVDGTAVVTGMTDSPDFPLRQPAQAQNGGGLTDGFVTALAPGGASLAWSTYLGGDGFDVGMALAAGPNQTVWIVGFANSTNFPTADAFQPALNGAQHDAFVAMMTGPSLTFSSYLGGSGLEWARAVALDNAGGVYVAGFTSSLDFPGPMAYQPTNAGPDDAFVVRIGSPVPPAADLVLRKADVQDPVCVGQNVAYLLTLRNSGTASASGVTITDVLPPGLSFASATPSVCTSSGQTVTCTVPGTLAPGAESLVVITATATQAGEYDDSAVVGATEADANPVNNQAVQHTTVNDCTEPPILALGLTKTAAPAQPSVGDPIAYRITVSNPSSATATHVRVTDALEPGSKVVTLQSVEPAAPCHLTGLAAIECLFPTWADVTPITVMARADRPGSVTNTATATADEMAPGFVTMPYTLSVQPASSLDLEVIASGNPAQVPVGGLLTYYVTVKNRGTTMAEAVRVAQTLDGPATLVYTDGRCGLRPEGSAGPFVRCNAAQLASGASTTFVTVVRPSSAQALHNRVQVTSDFSTVPNNVVTVTTVIQP